MKKLIIVSLLLCGLSGCAFQVENPFKGKSDVEKTQQLIQAVNALNEFAAKVDARLKELEPKKEKK